MSKYRSKEWLQQKYWEEKLTTGEIAGQAGCSRRTIDTQLDRLGIPKRTRAETMGVAHALWRDRDWILQKYETEGLPTRQVAKLAGCSRVTLRKWMKRLSVQRRERTEAATLAWKKGRFTPYYSVERRAMLSRLMTERMADPLMRAACIKNLVHLRGKDNPSWRGGTSAAGYPSTFNNKFKKLVRERDGYKCAICGLAGKQVHHIDYDKMNTVPENCITLCRGCHRITNLNRDYWQRVLSGLILEKEAIQGVLPLFPSNN